MNCLVNERMNRSIEAVRRANLDLVRLNAALDGLPVEVVEKLRPLLPMRDRAVDIVEVRPAEDLPGSVFSGLFSVAERRFYFESGRMRASCVGI